MTLNDFAKLAKLNGSQLFQRDVRMIFLGGKHYLTWELNFTGVESVRMISANTLKELYNDSEVHIEVIDSDLIFDSVGSLTIENVEIIGATFILENAPKRHADIRGVHLLKSTLLYRYHSAESEAPAPPDDNEVQYSNATSPPHTNIRIENSIIEHSHETGFRIVDKRLHGDLNIDIQNTSISHNTQGGILIESTAKLRFTITDSVVEGNSITTVRNVFSAAAGLGIFSGRPDGARVTIRGTLFANNQDLRSMPMVVWVSRALNVEIEDSKFKNNRGSAVRAANIKDSLRLQGNVTFRNNMAQTGGALALLSTKVNFMPGSYVVFENNHAHSVGGAIFVESRSVLYEENNPNTLAPCFYQFPEMNHEDSIRNLTFSNNSAYGGGHGIYGASLRSYCLVDKMKPRDEYPIRSGDQLVQDGFLFNETTDEHMTSMISSQPFRVCILSSEEPKDKSISEICTNVSQIFMTLSAYPGEEFSLKVILVGAEFGTGTGEVYAQFLPIHDTKPRLHSCYQVSQKVTHLSSPKTLRYSVFSSNSYEVLVLTTTAGTLFSYGDKNQILEDIETYNSSNIIPVNLLTTPVYINVSLSRCPTGFYLESQSMGCKCNPHVCNEADGDKAEGENVLLYVGENRWVSAYDDGHVYGIIMHYNCPYDYCKASSNGIDLSNPDSQCAMDHAGVLCGRCEAGYSMALGTDRCLPCSNNNIALILFFGAAGFFLVFVIHALNITVTQGTINGLLFYGNIVWAYRSIFFAHHKNWFLKMFVAWLNLDFGIETCFSKGLTAFGKSWMQFMFPLYIWLIAASLMLFVHCSEKLPKRFGSSSKMVRVLVSIANCFGGNSGQVMATLFILSYTKLLRTSITALVPANLHVYTDSGEQVDSLTKVVWAYDGNLAYGQLPHIFLFLAALVVLVGILLPYTVLLLFVQPVLLASKFQRLKWIGRMRPHFDAYIGPLNPPNHFWVGLLLLVRFVLVLTFIVTYASNPTTSLVALVISVVLLLAILTYTGPLYNNPTKIYAPLSLLPNEISFRSIMDVSFLLNLVVLGVSVLSVDFVTGNIHAKASILYTSIIVAFFQFVGIIFYHIWSILKKKTSSPSGSCVKWRGYQTLDTVDTLTSFPPLVTNADGNGQEGYPKLVGDTAATTSGSTLSTKVTNGTACTANYHTSCDNSDLRKPTFTGSTADKEPPPSYASVEVCKSKSTDSTTKKDHTFTSSAEIHKPMLNNSTSTKENCLGYSSFELRKPILTDSIST